jgi:lysophospholipase L1-like esterase
MLRKVATGVTTNGRAWLINLALLIGSIVVALVLGEIAFRLMGWQPMYVSPERDRFWKYDSLLGWAHQPGQEGIFETRQFRTFVRINQKGLRDREHAYTRSGDSQRILVLGDSFAWGYGVEDSERVSQLLEAALNAEVINAGVSGYSTDQELLWLRGEGVRYDTDLIILFFTGNDIGHNRQQLVNTIYYKPRFVNDAGQLSLTGYPVPQISAQDRFVYQLSQHSALAFYLVQRYFDLLSAYREMRANSENSNPAVTGASSPGDSFGLTIALLDEVRVIADSKGAPLMIVATDRWWNGSATETYADFIGALRAEGFLVLDVEAQPGFDFDAMTIPDDGHWSKAGHEFVATEIEALIEQVQLLSRSQDQASVSAPMMMGVRYR